MDVPADRTRPTSAPPVHPSLREAARSPRRRRPTGAAPPLPYRLQSSGVGWLVAAVVLVGFAPGEASFCRGYQAVARIQMPVDNEEGGQPIARCTLDGSLAQVWPQILVQYDPP